MTMSGLDWAAAWVQCSWMHKRSHDSIEVAVWVEQTLLGRAPYLQGQSDLQGQPDFASGGLPFFLIPGLILTGVAKCSLFLG